MGEIIGFFGLITGFTIVAMAIFTASFLYFRNPKVAGA
jgi:hypothetical protein